MPVSCGRRRCFIRLDRELDFIASLNIGCSDRPEIDIVQPARLAARSTRCSALGFRYQSACLTQAQILNFLCPAWSLESTVFGSIEHSVQTLTGQPLRARGRPIKDLFDSQPGLTLHLVRTLVGISGAPTSASCCSATRAVPSGSAT